MSQKKNKKKEHRRAVREAREKAKKFQHDLAQKITT